MSCDMLPASMKDERPKLLELEKLSCCDDSLGDDTADTESVTSDNSARNSSANESLSALPRSCLLRSKKQRRNITWCEDSRRHGSPRAARHMMEEHEVAKMWYNESEFQDVHREMLLVHAPSIVFTKDNPRAADWWKTLFYFHKETPAPVARDEKVLLMRAKLVQTYVEADEIIGLERILLGLLNQGYTTPRRSLLDWIQAQQKGGVTTESIAAFQRRVSLPFRLFARELALAQSDALAMQGRAGFTES